VIIAARLEPLAEPGGICISARVREDAAGKMALEVDDLGTPALKNIAARIQVFRVRLNTTAQNALPPPEKPQTRAPRLSLVVLPFTNLSGDGVPYHIVDGITEDLTTDLSRLPDFLVIDRNSAYGYKGKPIDIRRVGVELGVHYAVEGSVRKTADGALRISVQLVSTETGTHIWADRFVIKDGGGYDIDNIVRPIAWALNAQIVTAEHERSERESPGNPDGTDLLLRARVLTHLPPTPERHAQVLASFERAVEFDPSSATALAGLAEALLDSIYWDGIIGWEEDPTVPAKLRRAEELLARAEMLRPDDLKVMWTRVHLLGTQGRHTELIEAAERTIEAHPNSGGSHLWLGICLIHDGRAADAIAEFEQSIRLHPRNPSMFTRYLQMGIALLILERYGDAVRSLQRSLAIHPNKSARNHGTIHTALAAAQALAGNIQEAQLNAAEASRLWPTLTVRSFHQATYPIYGAQVSHMCDGLRLAGMRDHADEDADPGVASDDVLHTDYEGPTPATVPGAQTIRTLDLAAFVEQRRVLVLDTSRGGRSIPGSIGLWGAGIGGSILDEYQNRLDRKMKQLTHGDRHMPVVATGWNSERYHGRNLALRLVALGYTEVYWWRGGREAWEVAGLPETELTRQDW
jgi:TolB-like protein